MVKQQSQCVLYYNNVHLSTTARLKGLCPIDEVIIVFAQLTPHCLSSENIHFLLVFSSSVKHSGITYIVHDTYLPFLLSLAKKRPSNFPNTFFFIYDNVSITCCIYTLSNHVWVLIKNGSSLLADRGRCEEFATWRTLQFPCSCINLLQIFTKASFWYLDYFFMVKLHLHAQEGVKMINFLY